MRATTTPVHRIVRPMLHAGWLLAAGAQAQTPGCEQFKSGLVKRLQSDARGLVVEALPAGDALPAGAKVVGNCGGGAYRIVLRSGAAAGAVAAEAPAASRPVVRAAPPASAFAASAASQPPAIAAVVVASAAAPPEVVPTVQETAAAPGSGLMAEFGHWLWVLVLLPIGVWVWRWAAHRRLYDQNGLPRGPRF